MRKQRLPGHIDRALGRQDGGRKGRRRAGRRTEAGEQAERLQAVHRLVPGVLADRVVDHLHATPAGDLLDPRQEVFLAVVDGVSGALLLRQSALRCRPGRSDQLQSEGACPLARDQPDAAGRRMEQHEITLPQAALRLHLLQQVLRRQALEHHGRTGLEIDGVWQLADAFGRHHADLAIAARRLAGVGGAIACLEVRHARSDGLDHAGRLHPELQRHRQLVHARALVNVDEVQADRLVPDPDLAGSRLADSDIDDLHLFGTAMLVDADGSAHGDLLVVLKLRHAATIRSPMPAVRTARAARVRTSFEAIQSTLP